jgi:hypothetical protein
VIPLAGPHQSRKAQIVFPTGSEMSIPTSHRPIGCDTEIATMALKDVPTVPRRCVPECVPRQVLVYTRTRIKTSAMYAVLRTSLCPAALLYGQAPNLNRISDRTIKVEAGAITAEEPTPR